MEEGGSQNVTQIVEERVQTNSSKEVTGKLSNLQIIVKFFLFDSFV